MKRQEIPQENKWKLEDIFDGNEEWEKNFANLKTKTDACQKYRGNLKTKDQIFNCIKDNEQISQDAEKLFAYAKMRQDEDIRDSKYKTLGDKIENLYMNIIAKNSFIIPSLCSLPVKFLKELQNSPEFSDYNYFFKKLIDDKKHILSEKEEKLLAEGGEIYGSFSDIFSMIDNADLLLPEIIDDSGKKITLSHAKYGFFMQSKDRNLRKRAFKQYYKAYINQIHTIAQVYGTSVKKDWFLSKVHRFSSCMERALKDEDVSADVYKKLLDAVGKGLKPLHSYVAFRKKVLKYTELHMYDMSVPIAENAQLNMPYEKACELVLEGLKPLGEEYNSLLKNAITGRWIDVYENDGKRSGAYSFGVHGIHPFILLNYEKTAHEIFTIAHELGHSLHSYYSNKNQPYSKADYTIFVAEVASTVNEVLLLKYIIKNTKDVNLKKYLLSYYLDMFRTTLFRQTMFSEFENKVHLMVENNEPLTHENMSEIYLELNKKYYGKSVVSDDEIKYEWARIPHFYRNFYVYKYATGITCAVSIAKSVLGGGQAEVDAYKKFLCSGGSDSPVELLKLAGVDLTSKKPYKDAMAEFEETLKELKKLYERG